MQNFNCEGWSLHAGCSGKGYLFSDKCPIIAHTLCQVYHKTIFLRICLDLLGKRDDDLGGDDKKYAVSTAENLLVTRCPDTGVQEVGREVLGISMVFIDILYDVLFDGPEDDCIVGIPREPFSHGGAKNSGSCNYDGIVIRQGATPSPCGQIMVRCGMFAS